MSETVGPVVFYGCRSRVDALLDAHVDMSVVERTIDACALDREEKDALWLWASGRRDGLAGSASERPIIGGTAPTEAGDPDDILRHLEEPGHD